MKVIIKIIIGIVVAILFVILLAGLFLGILGKAATKGDQAKATHMNLLQAAKTAAEGSGPYNPHTYKFESSLPEDYYILYNITNKNIYLMNDGSVIDKGNVTFTDKIYCGPDDDGESCETLDDGSMVFGRGKSLYGDEYCAAGDANKVAIYYSWDPCTW